MNPSNADNLPPHADVSVCDLTPTRKFCVVDSCVEGFIPVNNGYGSIVCDRKNGTLGLEFVASEPAVPGMHGFSCTECVDMMVPILACSASSSYSTSSECDKAYDGSFRETFGEWMTSGEGSGSFVTFEFSNSYRIHKMK